MNDLSQRIIALDELGTWLRAVLNNSDHPDRTALNDAIQLSFHKNGWFTQPEVERALGYWADHLKKDRLEAWTSGYAIKGDKGKKVLLVLAGNIPLVGMHDVVSTFLSGHQAMIKCSTNDPVLLPYLFGKLKNLHPDTAEHLRFEAGIQKEFDAVLATGSNNSSRHFEAYFSHVPHVIRSNRTGVAVLDGSESEQDLEGLMLDAFTYFGLGCRNVTKLYLPEGYDLDHIFKASMNFLHLIDSNKYVNNYTYHKALMMLERIEFYENDLIVLRESDELYSPVSVLNYSFYQSKNEVDAHIKDNLSRIQCVVGNGNTPFGKAQKPGLKDYADGVDTLEFLVSL